VLVGKEYWAGMLSWITDSLLAEEKISAADPDLLHVADDPVEVAQFIRDAHNHQGSGLFD
jgi:predicted Rossmann-fold nucleotide-binding protein